MKFTFLPPRPLLALLCLLPGLAWADDPRDAAVLDALFQLVAPPADWREQLRRPDAPHENPPPPDAPIEGLVDFWIHAPDGLEPDPGVPLRLLAWCEAHPEDLQSLLRWMPADDTDCHLRLKAIVDRFLKGPRSDQRTSDAATATGRWLMFHSGYFRRELIEGLRKDFSGTDDRLIATKLQALARLDPHAAEKLLLQLSANRDAFVRAAALVWLHRLQLAGPNDPRLPLWRSNLQKTAASSFAPFRARDYAVTGLMEAQWDGRDEWFLGLFADPSLAIYQTNELVLIPLVRVTAANPDYWIPKIVPLVGNPNPTIHNNAVRCLCEFARQKSRADALRALLPWVGNPNWADLGGDTPRRDVVYSLTQVDLPECVPGLLQAVEREQEYILLGVVEALAHYHVKTAAPAVRAAVDRAPELKRDSMTLAAIELGAYSAEEMALAIQALLHQLSTEKGEAELENYDPIIGGMQLDPQVRLGKLLWHQPIENEELVRRLLRLSPELARSEPQSAERLSIIIAGWKGDAAMEAITQRLQSGELSAPWIAQLLAHRKERATQVARIAGLHGISRGVQAACTGVPADADAVLHGEDRSARLALLACARHIRLPLPLDSIAPFMDAPDVQLAHAAESYLATMDDPAARAVVLRHHPKQALILGGQEPDFYDPKGEYFSPAPNAEQTMQRLVLSDDGPLEILALLSSGGWGNDGQRLVLVYSDRTVLQWLESGGRRRERVVPAGELARLRAWLDTQRVDDLAPYDEGAADGIQYTYIRLTRDGGRQISMNNPPGPERFPAVFLSRPAKTPDPAIYGRLVDQFRLISSPPMTVTYEPLSSMPGFRLLHANEQGRAQALTWDRGKLVVQLRRDQGITYRALGKDGLSDGAVGTPSLFQEEASVEHWDSAFIRPSGSPVSVKTGPLAGKILWPGWRQKDDVRGIWASDSKSGEPALFMRGVYADLVPSADGKWLMAAKEEGPDWATPNGIVRINVARRREFPIDLPPADNARPLAWLPAHAKALIYRAKDSYPGTKDQVGPDEPEFHLLDPASGELSKTTGEFQPFLQQPRQSLQPSSRPHEVWAALPSGQPDKPATTVGRYDTRDFRFETVLTIPALSFSSPDMWVDETAHHVTFLVNGDVLQLALP